LRRLNLRVFPAVGAVLIRLQPTLSKIF
jgi:hypothetical protein